ncbi:MAG: hypothetical protein NDI82_12685, partial [Anaeromyxobacteraceae bacterium]|nr:hypothetical protein [Anaeromyxobacteraceae bacterium]
RRLPVILLFWARYAFQAVAMGLWLVLRHRRAGFATSNPRFQGLRGLLLMPFSYLQIGFATLIGAAMFGARPDGWSLAGMAVVAGSGAWAARLNARGAAAGRA